MDDEFEKGYEKPAVYSQEARFCAMTVKAEKLVVIVPWNDRERMPGEWASRSTRYDEHRLNFVVRQVNEEYPGYCVVDCTDGDYSKLPGLESFDLWYYTPYKAKEGESRIYALVRQGVGIPKKDDYAGYWNRSSHFRLYDERFLEELRAQAVKDNAAFFDCTDGDFSNLPAPPVVEPEPEEDPADWEDDDDNDDDDDDDN